jgi:triacylglycerol esterase/lipase EstA (alpha/beta hydrolase family)
MRVLVTGSRDWDDVDEILWAMRQAWQDLGSQPFVLVHGGARGADSIADAMHRRQGWPVEVFEANWERYGKRAGFIRNHAMVTAGADLCLAFIKNESRGATMAAQLAQASGIETRRYLA